MKREFKGDDFQKVLSELILFSLDSDKFYTLEIKEKKQKRSLDANAYCWTLLNQLSHKLKTPAIELYRLFIRRIGSYTIVPIKSEAAERYAEIWQGNGYGWLVDNLGDSKIEGYTNLKCYHGSSCYTTAEMSKLIDEIVFECKQQGIETATGAELALLKEDWK